MIEKDLIFLLQDLLSIHSMQFSLESREIKDDICKLIFDLMNEFQSKISDKEFSKHIYTDNYVYCWTQDNIEKLKEIDNVYLCCSKYLCEDPMYSFDRGKYKFLYKLHIKQNSYGVDLNSFFENEFKISPKAREMHWNGGNYHKDENEVIVKLKDIDMYTIYQIYK